MLKETLKGAVIASAVASLFMAGAASAQEKAGKSAAAKVQCKQDNSCGGQGSCAGKDNACKGKNSCKGHVFTTKSEKECTDKGGTVVTAKK
jgi:hypothetical protein